MSKAERTTNGTSIEKYDAIVKSGDCTELHIKFYIDRSILLKEDYCNDAKTESVKDNIESVDYFIENGTLDDYICKPNHCNKSPESTLRNKDIIRHLGKKIIKRSEGNNDSKHEQENSVAQNDRNIFTLLCGEKDKGTGISIKKEPEDTSYDICTSNFTAPLDQRESIQSGHKNLNILKDIKRRTPQNISNSCSYNNQNDYVDQKDRVKICNKVVGKVSTEDNFSSYTSKIKQHDDKKHVQSVKDKTDNKAVTCSVNHQSLDYEQNRLRYTTTYIREKKSSERNTTKSTTSAHPTSQSSKTSVSKTHALSSKPSKQCSTLSKVQTLSEIQPHQKHSIDENIMNEGTFEPNKIEEQSTCTNKDETVGHKDISENSVIKSTEDCKSNEVMKCNMLQKEIFHVVQNIRKVTKELSHVKQSFEELDACEGNETNIVINDATNYEIIDMELDEQLPEYEQDKQKCMCDAKQADTPTNSADIYSKYPKSNNKDTVSKSATEKSRVKVSSLMEEIVNKKRNYRTNIYVSSRHNRRTSEKLSDRYRRYEKHRPHSGRRYNDLQVWMGKNISEDVCLYKNETPKTSKLSEKQDKKKENNKSDSYCYQRKDENTEKKRDEKSTEGYEKMEKKETTNYTNRFCKSLVHVDPGNTNEYQTSYWSKYNKEIHIEPGKGYLNPWKRVSQCYNTSRGNNMSENQCTTLPDNKLGSNKSVYHKSKSNLRNGELSQQKSETNSKQQQPTLNVKQQQTEVNVVKQSEAKLTQQQSETDVKNQSDVNVTKQSETNAKRQFEAKQQSEVKINQQLAKNTVKQHSPENITQQKSQMIFKQLTSEVDRKQQESEAKITEKESAANVTRKQSIGNVKQLSESNLQQFESDVKQSCDPDVKLQFELANVKKQESEVTVKEQKCNPKLKQHSEEISKQQSMKKVDQLKVDEDIKQHYAVNETEQQSEENLKQYEGDIKQQSNFNANEQQSQTFSKQPSEGNMKQQPSEFNVKQQESAENGKQHTSVATVKQKSETDVKQSIVANVQLQVSMENVKQLESYVNQKPVVANETHKSETDETDVQQQSMANIKHRGESSVKQQPVVDTKQQDSGDDTKRRKSGENGKQPQSGENTKQYFLEDNVKQQQSRCDAKEIECEANARLKQYIVNVKQNEVNVKQNEVNVKQNEVNVKQNEVNTKEQIVEHVKQQHSEVHQEQQFEANVKQGPDESLILQSEVKVKQQTDQNDKHQQEINVEHRSVSNCKLQLKSNVKQFEASVPHQQCKINVDRHQSDVNVNLPQSEVIVKHHPSQPDAIQPSETAVKQQSNENQDHSDINVTKTQTERNTKQQCKGKRQSEVTAKRQSDTVMKQQSLEIMKQPDMKEKNQQLEVNVKQQFETNAKQQTTIEIKEKQLQSDKKKYLIWTSSERKRKMFDYDTDPQRKRNILDYECNFTTEPKHEEITDQLNSTRQNAVPSYKLSNSRKRTISEMPEKKDYSERRSSFTSRSTYSHETSHSKRKYADGQNYNHSKYPKYEDDKNGTRNFKREYSVSSSVFHKQIPSLMSINVTFDDDENCHRNSRKVHTVSSNGSRKHIPSLMSVVTKPPKTKISLDTKQPQSKISLNVKPSHNKTSLDTKQPERKTSLNVKPSHNKTSLDTKQHQSKNSLNVKPSHNKTSLDTKPPQSKNSLNVKPSNKTSLDTNQLQSKNSLNVKPSHNKTSLDTKPTQSKISLDTKSPQSKILFDAKPSQSKIPFDTKNESKISVDATQPKSKISLGTKPPQSKISMNEKLPQKKISMDTKIDNRHGPERCYQVIKECAFDFLTNFYYKKPHIRKIGKEEFKYHLSQQLKRNFERYLYDVNDPIYSNMGPQPRFISEDIMIQCILDTIQNPHTTANRERHFREFDDIIGHVGFNIPCYWCQVEFRYGQFFRAFPILDPIGCRDDTMYCQ